MNYIKSTLILLLIVSAVSCTKDKDDTPPPTVTYNSLNPDVGGPSQSNQVYLDLSTKTMTSAARNSWDLAFSCGPDFAVRLNGAIGALAYNTGESNFNSIDATDTVGLGAKLSLDAIFANLISPTPGPWLAQAIGWVDDPTGNLNGTAIAQISDMDQDNKVYIINSGKNPDQSARNWYKLKIDKSSGAYELRFAAIDGSSEQSATITKDIDYNFIHYSFENGMVSVEPSKTDWDIAFTTYTDYVNFGFEVPYFYQDYVLLNPTLVTVAENILPQDADQLAEFEAFFLQGLASLQFQSEANAIGANWRTVASQQPGSVTAVKNDRFYVVEDGEGNYFKIIFSKMLSDTGERGYPEIILDRVTQ